MGVFDRATCALEVFIPSGAHLTIISLNEICLTVLLPSPGVAKTYVLQIHPLPHTTNAPLCDFGSFSPLWLLFGYIYLSPHSVLSPSLTCYWIHMPTRHFLLEFRISDVTSSHFVFCNCFLSYISRILDLFCCTLLYITYSNLSSRNPLSPCAKFSLKVIFLKMFVSFPFLKLLPASGLQGLRLRLQSVELRQHLLLVRPTVPLCPSTTGSKPQTLRMKVSSVLPYLLKDHSYTMYLKLLII